MKCTAKLSVACFIVSLLIALMMTFRLVIYWGAIPVFTTCILALLGLIFSFTLPRGRFCWFILLGNLLVLLYVIGFVSLMIYVLNHFQ